MVTVRPGVEDDHAWVAATAEEVIAGAHQAHSRRQFHVLDHDLLIAERGGEPVGFLAWTVDDDGCEVLALATTERRIGAGTSLMRAVADVARERGCGHVHLVTTDDNTVAQAFYEQLGYVMAERIIGGVDECRRLYKPTIPEGIHDELRYERVL